jgi:hypothetical protein
MTPVAFATVETMLGVGQSAATMGSVAVALWITVVGVSVNRGSVVGLTTDRVVGVADSCVAGAGVTLTSHALVLISKRIRRTPIIKFRIVKSPLIVRLCSSLLWHERSDLAVTPGYRAVTT